MSKYSKKIIFSFIALAFLFFGSVVNAQVDHNLWNNNSSDVFWGGHQADISSSLGLGSFDPRIIISNLINIAMGFLGIMTVIMIMLAGVKIMLSSGNADDMEKARGMLWSTFVGTFLILASFGIAKFAINSLVGATGSF